MVELSYVPIYGMILTIIFLHGSLPIILIMIEFYKNEFLLLKFSINLILQIIYMILKTIFEEYKIDNKIFAIDIDNASNNNVVIPQLIMFCNPYFGGQFFFIKDVHLMF